MYYSKRKLKKLKAKIQSIGISGDKLNKGTEVINLFLENFTIADPIYNSKINRLIALKLLKCEFTQTEIAKILNVTRQAINQWSNRSIKLSDLTKKGHVVVKLINSGFSYDAIAIRLNSDKSRVKYFCENYIKSKPKYYLNKKYYRKIGATKDSYRNQDYIQKEQSQC